MTIIDYASPRPRSKLRLSSRSRIVCQMQPGWLVVTEKLQSRAGAIGAVTFAIFLLIYFCGISFSLGGWDGLTDAMFFLLPYLGLTLVVIHQTWRKTVLHVTTAELRLTFSSPLHRTKYHWSTAVVADVFRVITADADRYVPLGELQIQITDGQNICLFTDHRVEQIDDLVGAVKDVLAGEA